MGTTTRLMTFAEFERLPEEENDWKVELIDGELLRMPPPFAKHTRISHRLRDTFTAALQKLHAEAKATNLGEAFVEMGYLIGDNWVIPDVSITSAAQREGKYIEGAPALAIEVISMSNRAETVHRKTQLYLENGAREVWIFWPRTSTVSVVRGNTSTDVKGKLTTDLLPGLTLDLAEIFGT